MDLVTLVVRAIDLFVDVLDVSEQCLHVHEVRLACLKEVGVEGLDLAQHQVSLKQFLRKD